MPHSTIQQSLRARRKTYEERYQDRQRLRALFALPIYQLPAELLLNILKHLELDDYPSLLVAAWHLLRHHGIADMILTPRLKLMLVEPRRGFYGSLQGATNDEAGAYIPPHLRCSLLHHLAPSDQFFRSFTIVPLRLRGGFQRLPWEIRQQVVGYLEPTDCINTVLACYRFSDQDIEWLTHEKV